MLRTWVLGVVVSLAINAADLQTAIKLSNRRQYDQALAELAPLLQDGKSAPALFLAGQIHFNRGDFKTASEFFEKAVAAQPASSVYVHWLGKAYGRRAETSNPFSALGLAQKTRSNFEHAVQLDPRNQEAVNDLFTYYIEAPGIVGGGLDKAEKLTAQIKLNDQAEYEFALATIAEHRKEFSLAEKHLRMAMDLAPRQVGRAVDLARFLSKQGRHQESEVVFAQAERIDLNSAKLLYERANNYIRSGQNLNAAKEMLQKLLRLPLGPEDPSRDDAEKLLKRIPANHSA